MATRATTATTTIRFIIRTPPKAGQKSTVTVPTNERPGSTIEPTGRRYTRSARLRTPTTTFWPRGRRAPTITSPTSHSFLNVENAGTPGVGSGSRLVRQDQRAEGSTHTRPVASRQRTEAMPLNGGTLASGALD